MTAFAALVILALAAALFASFSFTARADDAEPGELCTGVCSVWIDGVRHVSDCGGGCCCDTLWAYPDGTIVWRVACRGAGTQDVIYTYWQLEDGSWLPTCSLPARGAPCDGCDGTGIVD